MGTRADFYIGVDPKSMEWLGSIAWDGYPTGLAVEAPKILDSVTQEEFRLNVNEFLNRTEGATNPADGWPWPWPDSRTTDYAYTFDDGKVKACRFGSGWVEGKEILKEEAFQNYFDKQDFPDMTKLQAVAMPGTKRSGVLAFIR